MAGDSGSLVVDARTGDIYGYIVSGDPTSTLAYIMPAYKVFEDIEKRFGIPPSLPTEIEQDRPRRRHHHYSRTQDKDSFNESSLFSSDTDSYASPPRIVPVATSTEKFTVSKEPLKTILRPPRVAFPKDLAPLREGVACLKDADKKGIPLNARWTKIARKLVNPEALDMGGERYEERMDYVIVLRVLTKKEVEQYAIKTQEIRANRPASKVRISPLYISHIGREKLKFDQPQMLPPSERPLGWDHERATVPAYNDQHATRHDAIDSVTIPTATSPCNQIPLSTPYQRYPQNIHPLPRLPTPAPLHSPFLHPDSGLPPPPPPPPLYHSPNYPHNVSPTPVAAPVPDDRPPATDKKDKKGSRRPSDVIRDNRARTSSCHSNSSIETDVDSVFSNTSDEPPKRQSHYSVSTVYSVHSRHTTINSDDHQPRLSPKKDGIDEGRRRNRSPSDRKRRSMSAGPRHSDRLFGEVIPARTTRRKDNQEPILRHGRRLSPLIPSRRGRRPRKNSDTTPEVSKDRPPKPPLNHPRKPDEIDLERAKRKEAHRLEIDRQKQEGLDAAHAKLEAEVEAYRQKL